MGSSTRIRTWNLPVYSMRVGFPGGFALKPTGFFDVDLPAQYTSEGELLEKVSQHLFGERRETQGREIGTINSEASDGSSGALGREKGGRSHQQHRRPTATKVTRTRRLAAMA
jgi:hypothetical protein